MDLIAIQSVLGHAWIATTMNYVHVTGNHVEDAWIAGQPCRHPSEGTHKMRWNLRLAAANRGVWKASELQRMLADHGLVISAGKMSGLWSGEPASIKLADLNIICVVLGCGVEELLIPQPDLVQRVDEQQDHKAVASSSGGPPVTPKRKDGRSLPPV
jgi:DNA-binding Xre family transcriptional regulator